MSTKPRHPGRRSSSQCAIGTSTSCSRTAAVVLNKIRVTRGGKILEQDQVVVMHIQGGKIAEVGLQFSDQQSIDEFATS